jgi:phage antirepressor YoqD-like protein
MTLLKNTDEVVSFKFNLVKSFKLLKEVVNKPKTLEEQVKETVLLLDNRIKELETTIKIQAPKVEFAEAVGSTQE